MHRCTEGHWPTSLRVAQLSLGQNHVQWGQLSLSQNHKEGGYCSAEITFQSKGAVALALVLEYNLNVDLREYLTQINDTKVLLLNEHLKYK